MKRRPHKDPVTSDKRDEVLARDSYRCVAPKLGATDACMTKWGGSMGDGWSYRTDELQLDHVLEQPMAGKRAPSDAEHLVTECPHHHLDGWATAHRPELRDYLAKVNAA